MSEFAYPLSPDERRQVAALLQGRTTVVVGDYRLYANDPDGFIEADDAYGLPSCWSGDSAAEDALQWVDNQYAHEAAERAAFEADNGGPYIDYDRIQINENGGKPVPDEYQFDAEEMKLVCNALTVYYDSCGDHYRNAPTQELREKILEVTGELEVLIDRLNVRVLQD